MKEFVLPLFTVLTMSSGFAVAPGWLSVIAFIVNDSNAGLCGFLQSRQLAAMTAALAGVAMEGTECAVCVVVGSVIATIGWVPEGNAMAMISSASCRAAAPILSASAGLEIIWFIGFMVGQKLAETGLVVYRHCPA